MKIGIIGAMDVEVAKLKADMEVSRVVEKASMEFYEGKLNGKDVVVVKCGIGKVDAGNCVQILCDLFDVTHVINTGVAGSLDAAIDIGDIVVSEDAVFHDVDVTPLGYEVGEMPGVGTKFFPADQTLVEDIKKAAEVISSKVGSGDTVADNITLHFGRVCSGDQFLADDQKKNWIVDTFGGKCGEMEGAAIAQAAYLNKIPFVIIRAISDKADGSSSMEYPEFEKRAAKDCAAIVEEVVTIM
ncbi:MAG TPA: 5'-methylthioadenosine/adenosylhomocysteine nucleosidase [Lachnospiraceae bacterium]|nr:5'-methylthioadenosine/adenosylhomocysteine nucleosidase [Lachnospiraceae bacterium]